MTDEIYMTGYRAGVDFYHSNDAQLMPPPTDEEAHNEAEDRAAKMRGSSKREYIRGFMDGFYGRTVQR